MLRLHPVVVRPDGFVEAMLNSRGIPLVRGDWLITRYRFPGDGLENAEWEFILGLYFVPGVDLHCTADLRGWSLCGFVARNRMCRFSVLPYANALPLVHFLRQVCPEAELVYRTPRQALDALLMDQVDAALIPVIDYLDHPDIRMIEGLGICADGDVTSVLLQCRRPLREIRTVQPDPESKTSNALVRVLLNNHFRMAHTITYVQGVPAADARVCIGDRALCSPPAVETYDLAGEWKNMTGLPFVFAVWVVGRSCPQAEDISTTLRNAKELGCQSLRTLAQFAAERLSLPEDRCRDYLEHRLHYDVGPREDQAIDRFRRLAAEVSDPDAHKTLSSVPFETRT